MASGFPITYLYSPRMSYGKIAVPVVASQALYSNFEHVTGVVVQYGTAYSIDKLKILNTLIDRLNAIKRNPLERQARMNTDDMGRIDALIEQYGKELHALAARASVPYKMALPVEPGMLVSVAA
jgi:hypothetical protein